MTVFNICKTRGTAIQLINELWECKRKEPCNLQHKFDGYVFCRTPICEAIIKKREENEKKREKNGQSD
jgi:hypothetical protein